MAGKIRVQEFVKLSGKKYLSHLGYDNIKSAYLAMRSRAMTRVSEYNRYDAATDTIKNDAIVEQDHNTTITITHGRSVRVFSLVHAKDRTPIPFGHLLKKAEDK